MQTTKFFYYESRGSVFWIENNRIMFTPMSSDGTFNLDEGGEVEVWEDAEGNPDEKDKKTVCEKLDFDIDSMESDGQPNY